MKRFSFSRLSLTRRFLLVSALIMAAGTFGIGNWIGLQIESGVIQQAGLSAALEVNAFVLPLLQGYDRNNVLDNASVLELSALLNSTPLGKYVDGFLVRDMNGAVIFSSGASLAKIASPTASEMAAVSNGSVVSKIAIREKEQISPQQFGDRLVKVISPVRSDLSGKIFAVVEFYQEVDALERAISAAKTKSWIVIGAFMLGIYLLMAFTSNRFNATIERQMKQNQQLHERVREAAASVATLHEQLLRRVGSELHDGPAQDLSLALMQMDTAIGQNENPERVKSDPKLLQAIQSNLQNALNELRAVSSGLSLPQLAGLNLSETIAHVVRAHERRTGTKVEMELGELPGQVPQPIKITIYRVVQEALNNAWHHAQGKGQRVEAFVAEDQLVVQITDAGPGFGAEKIFDTENHLGLEGMRERVESLGGIFEVESQVGRGMRIQISLSLDAIGKIT